MKRWFHYQESGGSAAIYTTRSWLQCECAPRTRFTVRSLIRHRSEFHLPPDMVSLVQLRLQTLAWREDWMRRTLPGPYVWNAVKPAVQNLPAIFGITS